MRDHQNVRVTVVHRQGDKDWAGTGRYLSIRAYRDSSNTSLYMGPDIPIHNPALPDEEIERLTAGFFGVILLPSSGRPQALPSVDLEDQIIEGERQLA
jgi:hypothetical protein